MKLRVAPLLAQFKEGIYPAVVEGLELQQGTFGDYLRWSFSLRSKSAEVTVTGLTSTVFNPKSKFYRWASAVTGRDFDVNDELDTESLRGAPCRVYVVVKELDGGGSINQVERALPADAPRDEDDDRPPL